MELITYVSEEPRVSALLIMNEETLQYSQKSLTFSGKIHLAFGSKNPQFGVLKVGLFTAYKSFFNSK